MGGNREKAILNGLMRIIREKLGLSNVPELAAETTLASIFGIDLYGFIALSVKFRKAVEDEYGEDLPEATYPQKTLGEIAGGLAERLNIREPDESAIPRVAAHA